MHSNNHNHNGGSAAAPPRRPPRRWKSSSTANSDLFSLDDISEVDVFRPRAPLRTKSCEELEAELLLDQPDEYHLHEVPTHIDLSQLAQNLHNIQLENDMMWDEEDDEQVDADLEHDDDNDNRQSSSSPPSRRASRTHSFLSVGSSMTAAQQREPGRFVTPASSFYNNATTNAAPMELTCAGVPPVERVTVDPYQFMTADMSFRLPLVGSLTDDNFVVHKKAKTSSLDNDNDDDLKKERTSTGRKTIQLDMDSMPMPAISLDLDDAEPAAAQEEEEAPPAPKPIMFGKLKRESRRLVRPNLPF